MNRWLTSVLNRVFRPIFVAVATAATDNMARKTANKQHRFRYESALMEFKERAAKEADEGDEPTFIANRIRALKEKP